MAELLKDFDMYVPGDNGRRRRVARADRTSVRRRAVQVRFAAAPVNGAVVGPGVDSAGVAGGFSTIAKPICAVLAGNLFNDDKILSVAHQFQINTDVHTRHPNL